MNSVDVFATVKIHRKHYRNWVMHLCTSGTTSHKPLSTDPVIMPAKKNTDVILVQKILTNTSNVTSCIVMLKDVIKVSLLQKGPGGRTNP
jgi:hypothetical protein